MMKRTIFLSLLAFAALFAQAPAGAPRKAPAHKSAAAPAPSGIDTILQLKKGGISDALIIKTIRSAGKPYKLSPQDMLKLEQAGISEEIIGVMMDPAAAASTPAAPAAAPKPVVAMVSAAAATPYPLDLPNVPVRKRRIAVLDFDHAAVQTWVQYWFHNDVNVGEGIRAMLSARMGQAKNVVLVEREKIAAIQAELNLNKNAGVVNQQTKAKTGKISGADCILMGDITIFGRDDKAQSSHESGVAQIGRLFGSRIPMAREISSMGTFSKEEKAVVAFALRIVDTETSEVLDTAEARGESSRASKSWASFTAGGGAYQADSGAMTSSNFQATIIGEATSNAVDKVVSILDEKIPQLPLRSRAVEGRVAKISSNSPILAVGANEGVAVGDRFEILRIVSEVTDPVTHQVLDVDAKKVGEFVATTVRDQITTGNYGGEPLSETYEKGYTARLVTR